MANPEKLGENSEGKRKEPPAYLDRNMKGLLPQEPTNGGNDDTSRDASEQLLLIAHRLDQVPDLTVRVVERPQSTLGDFYRELGELFEAPLSPANRYGGFKALRTRWKTHCQSTLLRPVLLIDEAQLAPPLA
jgi:hypothetical protein